MSKVLVIGAGGVGSVAVHKMAMNPDIFSEVHLASRTKAKCDAIAESDAEGDNRFRAQPLRHGTAGGSLPPRLARMRSLGITCRPDDGYVPHRHLPSDQPKTIDQASLERAHGFGLELIRALDRDVGRAARASQADRVAA